MLPREIAKSGTEDSEQTALFAYAAVARLHGFDLADMWAEIGMPALSKSSYKETGVIALPQLTWFHAIPNGGARGDSKQAAMRRGAHLRATGVRAGVADTFLPWPNGGGYYGLYLEMKVRSKKPKLEGSKGGVSDEQLAFREWALNNGYGYAVCYGWEEGRNALKSYIDYTDF